MLSMYIRHTAPIAEISLKSEMVPITPSCCMTNPAIESGFTSWTARRAVVFK